MLNSFFEGVSRDRVLASVLCAVTIVMQPYKYSSGLCVIIGTLCHCPVPVTMCEFSSDIAETSSEISAFSYGRSKVGSYSIKPKFHFFVTSRHDTLSSPYILAQEKVVTCFHACRTARHMTRVSRAKKWNLGFTVISVHAFAVVAY